MALNGRVPSTRAEGCGPTIWLAGSPDELREWMPLGIAGIVTNTVVLNQYAKQYGTVIELIKAYLDLFKAAVFTQDAPQKRREFFRRLPHIGGCAERMVRPEGSTWSRRG